jgi:flagellar hook-associated protein 2
MTTPISSISGLISGIDTSSLIDAIIAQERAPAVALESRETAISNQQSALTDYQTLLTNLQGSVTALSNGTAFDSTTTNVTAATGSLLASASSTADAVPGQYTLQVSQLAAAAKLSSGTVANATTALNDSGTFTVNGKAVAVATTDTLTSLRDKINAVNSGTTPSGVTASILTVSATDSRLILTANNSGSAGIALADTSGTTLQSLNYLVAGGATKTSAVLVAGADAEFTIDNVALVRSSNSVSDAVAGLTLNLTGASDTASTTITVARDTNAASTALQTFVTAYNAVVTWLQAQGTTTTDASGATSTPALYGDSLIRDLRSALPSTLLQSVFGASTDLATVASVGVSLGRDGKLTFDSTKFASAYQSRFNDVVSLFDEGLTSSDPSLSFVASGPAAGSGTYGVQITAAATQAILSTSGFSGTYDDGGTADTLTVTDTQSGNQVAVQLTSGMTTSDIVTALQSAFDSAGVAITAGSNGNEITLTHQNAGSEAGLSIATTGTGDGLSEMWGAPASAAGTNVAGTIGGYAATGSGRTLVANTGSPLAGVTVRYSGLTTGAVGTVTLSEGAASALSRILDNYLDDGGLLASRNDQLTTQNSTLVDRVSAIDARLALRRASLVAQYAAMEAAVAALRQGASSLLGSLSSSGSSTSTSSTQ